MFASIGEAANPGPILGTTNPTGALGKASMYDSILENPQQPVVWGIAETQLTQQGFQRFRHELKHQSQSWKIIHGAYAPPISNTVGTLGGRHTGVALMSTSPIRALPTNWNKETWQSARVQVGAVHVEQQWIKLGIFYGYAKDAHTKATKEKSDQLLQSITERIVRDSCGFRTIMGDFNATSSDLPQFDVWRRHGFREIQEIASTRYVSKIGTSVTMPQPPDFATANLVFLDFQVEFRALEKALLAKRRHAAKQRRLEDSNLVYSDVARPRALPVQTVVTKQLVVVTQVSEDGLQIRYDPPHFQCDQEVSTASGYLQIQHHAPGEITLAQECHVEVGDHLMQDTMRGSRHEVFKAFINLWDGMWNRHAHTEPSNWDPFVSKLTREASPVQPPMQLEPISSDQWKSNVRAKKCITATGPDGVSRQDLLCMPAELTRDLVACVNAYERGDQCWPPAALAGHITAIEKSETATHPKDFRPIAVLGLPYRVWASIRAKECLKFLAVHAPPGLRGNCPGQDTCSIWWNISRAVEDAMHAQLPLSGFLTDVCKAFNTLPRPVVFACGLWFGLPRAFLKTWHRAIEGISRRFVVAGAVSPPAYACTGYPEGDPLSVVAMFLLNLAMHHFVERAVQPIRVLSFVDNWEAHSSCAGATCRAWAAFEEFASLVDITLDRGKTLFWAVLPEDRQFLVQQGFKVSHHTSDLGGHLNYTRKLTNYTVRSRIAKTKTFWDYLARSMSPVEHKLKALSTVAWPRCLHGVSGVALGFEHLGKLRSAMMRAMRWEKKGASPILQCLLLPPRCDPVFYMLMDTFLAFRNNTCHDDACPVLTSLVLNPPRHYDPGPAGVFLTRLHMLNWQWDHHGFIIDHEGLRWNILDVPVQLLRSRLEHAWAAMLGASICNRQEFSGMALVDKVTSCSTRKHFPADAAGLLRTAMNGTFYTRNKQIHAGKVPTKACPYCDEEDSVNHRIWHCAGFSDLRNLSESTQAFLRQQPECTQLHGWVVQDPSERIFRESLLTVKDTTGYFEPVDVQADVHHIFVDGSCTSPTQPQLRVATWGVCVADINNDTFVPVASGGVPGLYQTTLRGEVMAAIAAFRWGLQQRKPFTLWTDNSLVFARVRAFVLGNPPPTKRKHDHDLWGRLHRYVRQAVETNMFQTVVKVVSHQEPGPEGTVEEWARKGNTMADALASHARHQLPSNLLWASQTVESQVARRYRACQEFHTMLVQFGLRCVEQKHVVESCEEPKWDEVKNKQGEEETCVSLEGLQRVTTVTHPHKFGDCLEPLHTWLFSLTTAADAEPLWLSSYQLFVHYQCSTGKSGFVYDSGAKVWKLADDFVHHNGYDFLKLASSLQAIIKAYAKAVGCSGETKLKMPWGCAIRSWQRCVCLRVSPSAFSAVDRELKDRGIVGIKKVTETMGELQCVNCTATALSFCLECKDYLCLKCYGDLHSKGFRKSHAPFCLVPCALCVVLPAKIHCTFTDKSLCHGCYAMKHIKMLPKDGKENAPRRINYVEQYNRYAAMAKKRAETKAAPSEEIPNLEDAAYESVLSTDWHPFYDARGVKYYHNFATGERMRQSPTVVPNTDEPGVEGNNGLKEAKAALGQEDESPRKEERGGSAPLRGSDAMPLSGFDSLKSDVAAAILAAEEPENRTLRPPYRQLMPNEADISETSLAGLQMTSLGQGQWLRASLHLFQDCLQLRSQLDRVKLGPTEVPSNQTKLQTLSEDLFRPEGYQYLGDCNNGENRYGGMAVLMICAECTDSTSCRWEVASCLLSEMSCWQLEANQICVNAAFALLSPWRALTLMDLKEEVALCQAIDASAQQGQWQQPLAWLSASFQVPVRQTLQSMAAAMTACANRHHWQFSLQILHGMTHLRLQPDTVALTCAVAALEKASQWQAAGFTAAIAACERATRVAGRHGEDLMVNIAQWRQALARQPTGELFFACAHFPDPWQRYRREVDSTSADGSGSGGSQDQLEEDEEEDEEEQKAQLLRCCWWKPWIPFGKLTAEKIQTMSIPTRGKDMNYDGLTCFEQLMLLKVLQPESVIHAINGFVAEVLDTSLLEIQPQPILKAMEELQEKDGKFRALLLRCDDSLASQCPSINEELKVLMQHRKATKDGRRAHISRCSPLQDIQHVREAALEGAFVLITELQLASEEFLADLEMLMEDLGESSGSGHWDLELADEVRQCPLRSGAGEEAEGAELCLGATKEGGSAHGGAVLAPAHGEASTTTTGHSHHGPGNFRLVLCTNTASIPLGVAEMCQKVAMFPPIGVKGRLRQLALGTNAWERLKVQEPEDVTPWYRTLFSLCLFHAVLGERYHRYQCCFQSTAYDA
eukprot:s10_g5.t1